MSGPGGRYVKNSGPLPRVQQLKGESFFVILFQQKKHDQLRTFDLSACKNSSESGSSKRLL